MARFVIENHLTDPDAIQDFDSGGYRFAPEESDGDRWTFVRPHPGAARRKEAA